jgi:methylglutaconyl-CoA hydratase
MSIVIKKNLPSATIILSRPDKRNALTRQMLADLIQALDDLHQERKVRAVILTGAGTAFCAGMDLAEMQETAKQPQREAWEQWYEDANLFRDVIDKMRHFPKPIIAAVNGPAMAGGMGLICAADIVLAAPEAQFALPEPRRGIVAGIVSPLLVFRVGSSHASNLLLTTRTIDAEEARRIALVHEIVKGNLLWARGQELAGEIAKSAPEAIQLTKRLLNETIGESVGTQLSAGAAASATARTTEAAVEGLAAFMERREPKWL